MLDHLRDHIRICDGPRIGQQQITKNQIDFEILHKKLVTVKLTISNMHNNIKSSNGPLTSNSKYINPD